MANAKATTRGPDNIHPDLANLAYPLANLLPLPGNPRIGDVGAVARSYSMFGQRKPIIYHDPRTGKEHHSRAMSPNGFKTQFGVRKRVPKPSALVREDRSGKYRYGYPLDRAMRRKLTALAQSYPRGRGLNGEPPSFHDGEPGSIPGDRSEART